MTSPAVAAPAAPARARALPLRDYLEVNAVIGGAIQLVTALLLASLTVSRADGGTITPTALAGILVGTTATSVLMSWLLGLYGGAADILAGRISLPDHGVAAPPDPFAPRAMWRAASGWAAGAALWAACGAGLVAVILDGRHAGTVVIVASLFAVAGVAGRAAELAARRRGIDAVRAGTGENAAVRPVPGRRRAWLHVALPLAALQAVVNGGFAWILFHDHTTGDAFAENALTGTVALADVGLVVALLTALFAMIANRFGAVDAALGRIDLRGLGETGGRVGPQLLVYIVLAGVFGGRLVGLFLPALPTLLRVAVVRGALAGAVVFCAAGFAYIRGALNESSRA